MLALVCDPWRFVFIRALRSFSELGLLCEYPALRSSAHGHAAFLFLRKPKPPLSFLAFRKVVSRYIRFKLWNESRTRHRHRDSA